MKLWQKKILTKLVVAQGIRRRSRAYSITSGSGSSAAEAEVFILVIPIPREQRACDYTIYGSKQMIYYLIWYNHRSNVRQTFV